jgi:beta-mannanase
MNKNTTIRFLYVSAALIISVGIVWALTLASNKSKGPVENILYQASEVVSKVEQNIILEKRNESRAEKLKWLQPLRSNKNKLIHSKEILLGAFDNNAINNFKPIIDLEDTLQTKFPLIHIYTAWGSRNDQQFPTKKVENIVELGSIPVITWEPWLTAFDIEKHPTLKPIETRDKSGLTDIANGVYDDYIKKWALAAKKINSSIILRWAHEMNDPYRYPWGPQNNTSTEFISAYKHIYQIFKTNNVTNVAFAWGPHPAYNYFTEYYPGDDVVDFIAIGTLNYGIAATWSKWWTFDDIFFKSYEQLSKFNKPIILSEFGSLEVGGNRTKWFVDAFKSFPQKYPLVKSVLFFHFDKDNTTTQQTLNWQFIRDKLLVKQLKTQISNWPDSLKIINENKN